MTESCHMYGPAVRNKMEFREGEGDSCINVFRFRRWHGADVDDIYRASRRRGKDKLREIMVRKKSPARQERGFLVIRRAGSADLTKSTRMRDPSRSIYYRRGWITR